MISIGNRNRSWKALVVVLYNIQSYSRISVSTTTLFHLYALLLLTSTLFIFLIPKWSRSGRPAIASKSPIISSFQNYARVFQAHRNITATFPWIIVLMCVLTPVSSHNNNSGHLFRICKIASILSTSLYHISQKVSPTLLHKIITLGLSPIFTLNMQYRWRSLQAEPCPPP
jgi:hypothetical protein